MREQQYKQDVVCVFVCVHVCMYVCVRVRGHVLVGRGHEHSVRLTTAYNHHHKTIQRLVNKHWTRFLTKQKGNPELPWSITKGLHEKSITQKQTSQNKIHTRISNTNKQTHTKTSLHKQMLEQKMPHMPRQSNKTPIPKNQHTTRDIQIEAIDHTDIQADKRNAERDLTYNET